MNLTNFKRKTKPPLFVITNSPLFILQHLSELFSTLSDNYRIIVLTSKDKYASRLNLACKLIGLPIRRNPSILDPLSVILIIFLRFYFRPKMVISFTPKGGLLNLFTYIFPGRSVHYFTGQRWSTLVGNLRTFLMIIDKQICLRMYKTFCDSNSQALYLQKELSVRKPTVVNYGSIRGVDHEHWRPAFQHDISEIITLFPSLKSIEHSLHDEQKLVFGFVGRICLDKGVDKLLESFILHLSKHPKSKLLLVGPVEEDFNFFEIINFYSNNIYHIDYTTRVDKIIPFLSTLILPSYREGFGSVVLEAAACRVPSIVTNIPGPTDFVEHGINGFVVPTGDVYALVSTLDQISSDPIILKRLGLSAYHKSLAHYKSDDVTHALASHLTSMIKN